MTPNLNRRAFLATSASLATLAVGANPPKPVGNGQPIAISSGSKKVVEIAMEKMKAGADPLDAAIDGVAVVEADPDDHSVGIGGTPNELGVVELDASVMHGPTHGGGAVAGLKNIMHPAAVARMVMQRTRHVLLVGDYATQFAREHGFPEVDLTTEVPTASSTPASSSSASPRTASSIRQASPVRQPTTFTTAIALERMLPIHCWLDSD